MYSSRKGKRRRRKGTQLTSHSTKSINGTCVEKRGYVNTMTNECFTCCTSDMHEEIRQIFLVRVNPFVAVTLHTSAAHVPFLVHVSAIRE